MDTPAIAIPQTPQQKYRQSEKCKIARQRYYTNKGRAKAHEYYERNKEVILNRSKERYTQLKNMAMVEEPVTNDMDNNMMT